MLGLDLGLAALPSLPFTLFEVSGRAGPLGWRPMQRRISAGVVHSGHHAEPRRTLARRAEGSSPSPRLATRTTVHPLAEAGRRGQFTGSSASGLRTTSRYLLHGIHLYVEPKRPTALHG